MTEPVIIGHTWDHAWAHPIGRVQTSVGQEGTVWNWSADPDALREYLEATLGGHKPQSRWQRILAWFGLAKPVVPYTHSFVPIVIGPPAAVTELWGFTEWEDT